MGDQNNRGFSLLELLIVVAIILIIVSIAIPSLRRSQQSANEMSTVATIKAIHAAQIMYASSNAGAYGDFQALTEAALLDDRLAAGEGTPTLNGYTYTIELSENAMDYTVQADPASPSQGRFDFYSGADAVVRYRTDLGGRTPGAPVQ
jgi:prepilin-type N-terminal cleavage/methylation domain-containing protein